MDDEIVVVNDYSLKIAFLNKLNETKKRDKRFKDYDLRFTKSELASIKKLKLNDDTYKDLSELRYCVNLEDLEISSSNARSISSNGLSSSEKHFNYYKTKIQANDFSFINELKNIKYLRIEYVDGLEKLDVSNLDHLAILELEGNDNLTEIVGLSDRKELENLVLLRNGINKGFDLEKLLNNSLSEFKLDFDLFPILSGANPNLERMVFGRGEVYSWIETIGDRRYNSILTNRMKEMDNKVKSVLNKLIAYDYSDIEKIAAIYSYLIQHVKYDYEALRASKNADDKDKFSKTRGNGWETVDKILDREQSSYNAIMEGKSVCEGYSNLMHYMLKSVGVESKSIFCAEAGKDFVSTNSNHAVLRAKLGDDWYYFDPTKDTDKESIEYFFKTKEQFSRTHSLSVSEENIQSPTSIPFTISDLNNAFRKVVADFNNGINEKKNSEKQVHKDDKVLSHNEIIKTVEQLLNISIKPYLYSNSGGEDNRIEYKTVERLMQEKTNTIIGINRLVLDGKINKSEPFRSEIIKEYDSMIEEAKKRANRSKSTTSSGDSSGGSEYIQSEEDLPYGKNQSNKNNNQPITGNDEKQTDEEERKRKRALEKQKQEEEERKKKIESLKSMKGELDQVRKKRELEQTRNMLLEEEEDNGMSR